MVEALVEAVVVAARSELTVGLRTFLVLCVGLSVWAIAQSSADGSGGSMAMVVPVLATAPVSFVWLALPDGAAMAVVAVLLGALANAAVIVWCGRALRRGRHPDPLR